MKAALAVAALALALPSAAQAQTTGSLSLTLTAKTAKALKARGFTFVGSTIVYAFMQAVGMIDDHVEGCWRTT